MYLAQNLKYLRKKNGETQKDISKLLSVTGYGFSEMTVSRYESGECEPELKKVILLAEHYNVTVDELLTVRMQDEVPLYLKNLQYLRKKYNMKQQEVADLLRVKVLVVSKYESGKVPISVDKLLMLSDYFNVSLDQLVKQELSKEANVYNKQKQIEAPDYALNCIVNREDRKN